MRRSLLLSIAMLVLASPAHAALPQIQSHRGGAEPDPDPTFAHAAPVLQTIRAPRVPLRQLIIQSFYPPNLDEAQRLLPGVATAFLTASGASSAPALYAAARGYTWWSPPWPVAKSDVDQAHALGLKVVPWTIDTPDRIRGAGAVGHGDDGSLRRIDVLLASPRARRGAADLWLEAQGRRDAVPHRHGPRRPDHSDQAERACALPGAAGGGDRGAVRHEAGHPAAP